MPPFRAAILALLLGAALVATAGEATALEDLAKILPPETVLYARTAGFNTLLSELEGSRMLRDGSFIAGLYRENVGKVLPTLQQMTEIPTKVWEEHLQGVKGAHFALFSFGRELADLDALGIIEIDDAEKVRELVRKTIGDRAVFAGEVAGARVMSVEAGPATVYYCIHEGKLFVTNRPERISTALENLAETPDKSLATLPAYRSGALRTGKDTTFFAYADVARLFTLLENTMGRFMLRAFNEIDKVVQLNGFRTACVASGMNHCRGRAVVDPDHAWLSIFRGEVGPPTFTSYLPPETFFALIDSGDIAKKWGKLKKHLLSENFPFAQEMKDALGEAQKMLGVSLDEIAATLGTEWAWFLPVLDARFSHMDDYMTFAFRIKDREKFDALVGKFLQSPVVKEMQKSGFAISREKHAGYEIIRGSKEGSDEAPCMAVVDDNLLMAGHVRALKAAIDAKTTGEGMLSRSALFLDGLPSASSKFASVSLPMMLMMDRDFVPLLDVVRDGAVLAVTADEAPGRIDLVGNESIPAFLGLLVSGQFLKDQYRGTRGVCIQNLNDVGKAIKAYREKNGRDPESLLALVPEYLAKEKLICPLDAGKEGHKCSYESAVGVGDPEQGWLIDAWCPHRLHGRLVLRRNGRAWSSSEESFLLSLERTREKK